MNDIFTLYQKELLNSLFVILILVFLKFTLSKIIRKVGDISNYNAARSTLIIRYVNIAVFLVGISIISIIWNVNFEDLGLLISSIFAVIGVALFAQWSILSNVTAGVILFFTFPFKIGDVIEIQDKDFPIRATIEDIKAFHLMLRTEEGDLVTYPNNLLLQKGVKVSPQAVEDDGSESL
ncbi:mechanosensitive ion channel domain-containing protein [Sinomicrobium sp.]